MSSDIAIAQFRFLERLLLVHGHWCYRRISSMVTILSCLHICYKIIYHKVLYLAYYLYWSVTYCKVLVQLRSIKLFRFLTNLTFCLADLLFLLQEYCLWLHSVLLWDLCLILRASCIQWLVHVTIQCILHFTSCNCIRSFWSGRIF